MKRMVYEEVKKYEELSLKNNGSHFALERFRRIYPRDFINVIKQF
jgi:hypothetical protein